MAGSELASSRPRQVGIVLLEIFLALFLAGSLSLERLMDFTGNQGDSYPLNFIQAIEPGDVAIFVVVFAVLLSVLEAIRRIVSRKAEEEEGIDAGPSSGASARKSLANYFKAHWKAGLVYMVPIFICWMIVWANYYPGTSMNDQLAVIGLPIAFANNHPLLYNLALSGCVRLGVHVLGSGSAGFALYVLLQMVLCSAAVSLCCLWLRFRRAPRWVVALVIAYFALTPLIGNYAMAALKDTLFGYALLLWVPFLFELSRADESIWRKTSICVLLALLVLATSLTRNNGLYVSIVLLLVVFVISFRRRAWKMILAGVVAVCLAFVPNVWLSAKGVHQLFRESVGVPLQQLSAAVCSSEGSLDEDEEAYLNRLIPLETLRSVYAPMSVDLVKYNSDFDSDYLQQTKREFIRVYLSVGMKHAEIYARAFLSQTYGYWSLFANDSYQGTFFRISDNLRADTDIQAMEEWGLSNRSLYPESISVPMDGFLRAATSVFPGPGACFALIMLGCFLLCCRRGSAKYVLVFLPFILLWGTLLIATPLACAFRYAFPFAVVLPFVVAMLFISENRVARKN